MPKALITGGSRGIGHAIVEALNADDWETVCVARGHLECVAHKCIRACVTTLTRECFSQSGPYDALICAAAVAGPVGPAISADPYAWKRCLDINLYGVWRTVTALLPELAPAARIVTFSGAGDGGVQGCAAYAAAKAGVVRYTECLAAELAKSHPGMTVNCIAPGPVKTELWDRLYRGGVHNEVVFAPDKAVDCVRWLLSEQASGVTGRWIAARWDDYRGTRLDDLTDDTWRMRRLRAPERPD